MHRVKKIVTAVFLLIFITMFIFIKDKDNIIEIYPLENVNISAGTIDFGAKDYRFRTIGEAKRRRI